MAKSEVSFSPSQPSKDLLQYMTKPSNQLIDTLKKHPIVLCEIIEALQSDIRENCAEVQERWQKKEAHLNEIQQAVPQGSVLKEEYFDYLDGCLDDIRTFKEILEETKQSEKIMKFLLSLVSEVLNEKE